jgi:AcrR family transcriptional regulator
MAEWQEGLRERKKVRTRHDIVESATRLFLARGFDPTTMDEIAAEAEVSRSTLFRYFGTKESLVFPNQEDRLEMFRRLLADERDDESPFDVVRRAIIELAGEFHRARRELLDQQRIIESSPHLIAHELAWYDKWESAIRDALAAHCSRDDERVYRARLIASAVFGVVRAALGGWYADGCRQDLVQLAKQELGVLERGVAAMAPFLLQPIDHRKSGG